MPRGNPNIKEYAKKGGEAKKAAFLEQKRKEADMIREAFEGLGGVQGLIDWAKNPKNKGLFYASIWPRILPKVIEGGGEGGAIIVRIESNV